MHVSKPTELYQEGTSVPPVTVRFVSHKEVFDCCGLGKAGIGSIFLITSYATPPCSVPLLQGSQRPWA